MNPNANPQPQLPSQFAALRRGVRETAESHVAKGRDVAAKSAEAEQYATHLEQELAEAQSQVLACPALNDTPSSLLALLALRALRWGLLAHAEDVAPASRDVAQPREHKRLEVAQTRGDA